MSNEHQRVFHEDYLSKVPRFSLFDQHHPLQITDLLVPISRLVLRLREHPIIEKLHYVQMKFPNEISECLKQSQVAFSLDDNDYELKEWLLNEQTYKFSDYMVRKFEC